MDQKLWFRTELPTVFTTCIAFPICNPLLATTRNHLPETTITWMSCIIVDGFIKNNSTKKTWRRAWILRQSDCNVKKMFDVSYSGFKGDACFLNLAGERIFKWNNFINFVFLYHYNLIFTKLMTRKLTECLEPIPSGALVLIFTYVMIWRNGKVSRAFV